ncbi:hypothetical protein [Carnobacterium alterfunditum]|nr:hypothetical protein [Carnobacterium alterfunditum]
MEQCKGSIRTIRLVNEISIFEEDFAGKVLESIEVEGKIHSRLISKKRK